MEKRICKNCRFWDTAGVEPIVRSVAVGPERFGRCAGDHIKTVVVKGKMAGKIRNLDFEKYLDALVLTPDRESLLIHGSYGCIRFKGK